MYLQGSPVSALDQWSVTSASAGAQTPSASKAAGAATVRHVAKRVIIGAAAGATVQPAIQVNLRDGATGAGTVLASWQIALGLITALSGVNCVNIDADNLNLVGTAATAMTLETTGNLAANTTGSCTLIGYDLGGARPATLPAYTS